MADVLNTTVTLGGTPLGSLDMVPVYIKKKLLMVAMKKLVFHQLADKEDLPEGQGKTARWIRYDRIGLPFLPATEGVTPPLTRVQPISKVEATVDQWMDGEVITDVAELTVYHKALQIIIERLGTQAAEVVDREIQRVLLGGTNVIFTDPAITDRTGITATSVMSTVTIKRVLAALRNFGAPEWSGGDFMGVFDPSVEMDLITDPTFQTAASYSNITPLMNAEIGRWMGVRWMRSNFIPVIVRNTAVNSGTNTSPAASGGETALTTAASYDLQITGLDVHGFETQIGTVTNIGFTAGDVLEFTLPALPAGVFAYNVYAAAVGGSRTLQVEATGAGSYHLTGGTTVAAGFVNILFSSTGRVAPIIPASGVSVHQTYILGKESFGALELTNIETMLTPNAPSDSDPMKQRRKASWKVMFKAVIKQPDFFRRIESSSGY